MRHLLLGRAFAAVVCASAATAAADDAAAWAALRAGEPVVALMRHADAPGVGDPPGWRLDDCRTQRNLGELGRADARAAGQRLKREGVRFARVLSSPWCRCLETARLADLGPPQVEARFSNAYVLADRRDALAQGGREVIAAWKGPGPLLVVTHGENIRALTGRSPATSDVVVVTATPDGTLRELGTIVPAAPQR
jgi:broad specificity phosphatase PhoE